MSDWQRILKDESIATLDKLKEKFGDAIDVEALKPACDNFRCASRPRPRSDKEVGDHSGNSTCHVEELESRWNDRFLDEAAILRCRHHASDPTGPSSSQPGVRQLLRFCTVVAKSVTRRRFRSISTIQRSRICASKLRSATHHERWRSDDAERQAAEYLFQSFAQFRISRSFDWQRDHVAPAGARHARILRDGAEYHPIS